MQFSQTKIKKHDHFLALNVLIAAIVHSQSGSIVSRLQSRYATTSSTESDALGFFSDDEVFTVTPAGRKYSLWRVQILFKVYNKPVEKKGQETYEALSARAKLFEEKVNDRTLEISSPCVCHRDAARASRAS